MTTPDPARCHLAYGLYVAFKRGQSQYTGTVYPVASWARLPDHHRARYLRRAERFLDPTHADKPLPERLFAAWWDEKYVKPYPALSLGLRALWGCVAQAYTDLHAGEQEA